MGYTVATTNSGNPLHWRGEQIFVSLELLDGPGHIHPANANAAILEGFSVWLDHIPLDVVFDIVGSGKGGNTVRWVVDERDQNLDESALATSLISYRSRSGEIRDVDIVVNSVSHNWLTDVSQCENDHDLQNAIAHEAGHFFGLGHSYDTPGATMYPVAPTCETRKRDLDQDDIAGVNELYGTAAIRAQTVSGCSAAGDQHTWLVAIIVMMFLFRRKRWFLASRATVIALIVCGWSTSINATTVRHLDLPTLTYRASNVVRGVVISQSNLEINGHIYTDSRVAVTECWSGECDSIVVVRQIGGELGDNGTLVFGIAELKTGDEAVLFLRNAKTGTARPVGMAQGAFLRIPDTQLLRRDLRDLRLVRQHKRQSGQLEHWSLTDLRITVEALTKAKTRQK